MTVHSETGPIRAVAPDSEDGTGKTALERLIGRWGIVLFVTYAVMVPLSYGIAPLSPRGQEQVKEEVVLRAVAGALPLPSAAAKTALTRYVTGESILMAPKIRAAAFFLPLLLVTVGALVVLLKLREQKLMLSAAELACLSRWAVAFAAVSIFIYPMTTQDFWLSVAWGRLTASGLNPYYEKFTPAILVDMPIQEHGERMTYGPLWAYVSGLVGAIARRRTLVEFLVFKVLLAGTWLLTLVKLRRLARGISPAQETLAIWVMGWLPLALHMAVAEGHNDIVMMFFLVTWLGLSAQGRHLLSPFALAAATMIKYITAPLALLELVRGWPQVKGQRFRYMLALAGALLASVALLLPFARDRHMLDPVLLMYDWTFWTPDRAIVHLGGYVGLSIPIRAAVSIMVAVYAVWIVHSVSTYWRAPSLENFAALTLIAMATIMLGAVGHVWPWFIVWILPLCALVRRPVLVTFLLVLALEGPFLHWDWIIGGGFATRRLAGVVLYTMAGAAAFTAWLIHRSRPRDELAAAVPTAQADVR